jgi:hypothetical protein
VKKHLLVAALVLASAFAVAASDQPNRTSAQVPGAGQNPQLLQTPFKVWPDGNYIFVVNGGTTDWTGPITVTAKCVPLAPTTSCGPNFPGGTFTKQYAKGQFPKGHGQTPVSAPNGNSVIITPGAGYDAIFMGLPVGAYRITASAGTNSSPETIIKITVPPPGSQPPVHVQPGAIQLAPTKSP